jgi:hypothetical protein
LVGSFSVVEASSSVTARAGDSGCPKVAEEGNDVGLRNLGVGAGRRHGTPLHADRDASFARSFDPCSSILTTQRSGKTGRWWGVLGGIAAGQTRVTGTNQHRGHQGGQSAARRASLLERAAWCVRKGRWSRPSSLRGKEGPGLVARTSIKQLQKSLGGV